MKARFFVRVIAFGLCCGPIGPVFAVPPCSCPDGTVFHDGDTVSFPAAHGTRAVGRIVSLNGCSDATYQYYHYAMNSSFKVVKTLMSQRHSQDVCSVFKLFSEKKASSNAQNHGQPGPSLDEAAQERNTVSSLEGISVVPGPVAGGFQVNEYVVANRDFASGGHKIKRGTPGQVQGTSPVSGDQIAVVFFTRPRIKKVERIVAITGIMGGAGAAIWRFPASAGLMSLAVPIGSIAAWEKIRPIRHVQCAVNPDDIQLLAP